MSVVGHVEEEEEEEEEEEAIVYGDWPTSGRGSPGAIWSAYSASRVRETGQSSI